MASPSTIPFAPPPALPPAATGGGRVQSIEAMRALAAFAVVCIHTGPLTDPAFDLGPGRNPGAILDPIERFAVPFFFIASGYFFAAGLAKATPLRLLGRYARRLGTLFVGWTILYALAPSPWELLHEGRAAAIGATLARKGAEAQAHPLQLLLAGTEIHLWFFTALLLALCLLAALIAAGQARLILPLSVPLYLLAIALNSYGPTPLGGSGPADQAVFGEGHLAAPLLVGLGYLLARRPAAAGPPLSLPAALALTALGLCLHLGEVFLLQAWVGRPIARNGLVFSTWLYGLGVMLIALAARDAWRPRLLAKLGGLSLGIYASHLLVRPWVYLLWKFLPNKAVGNAIAPFLVFALAAAFTWLMKRIPFARRLAS